MVVLKAASYLKEGSEEVYNSRAAFFKEQLLQHPQIKNVTESGFIPGQEIVWRQGLVRRVLSEPSAINTYHIFAVEERFFDTYGMELSQEVSSPQLLLLPMPSLSTKLLSAN